MAERKNAPYVETKLAAWRAEIEEHRARSGRSWPEIYKSMERIVKPETFRNWMSKKTHPPAQHLAAIARQVNADPGYMLSVLGLIESDHLAALKERVEAEDRARELQVQLDQLRLRSGTARLVEAAMASGKWIAHAYPVDYEFSRYTTTYSHRLTFVPNGDRRPRSDAEAYALADASFGDPLRAVGALRRVPDRSANPIDACVPEGHGAAYYYVRTLEALRPPSRTTPMTEIDRVVVVSTISDSWPGPVAALIARGIGFGYLGLRQLATMRFGSFEADSDASRAATARSLLFRHDLTKGYCLSLATARLEEDRQHGGQLAELAREFVQHAATPSTFVVLLDETDEFLADGPDSAYRPSGLGAMRSALVEAFDHSRAQGVRVSLTRPVKESTDPDKNRNLRFERSMYIAATILTILAQLKLPPAADDSDPVLATLNAFMADMRVQLDACVSVGPDGDMQFAGVRGLTTKSELITASVRTPD